MKHSILIQYDERDNIYVASIPELRGCISHGNTPEDAIAELHTAMELWLETALENGTEIPCPQVYVR
jgi:predicted RNase H-like HicB family nuclease